MRFSLLWLPVSLSDVFLPSLKKRIVGSDITRFSVAKSDSSSTLYLPMTALPSNSAATSSITGAIDMHGPHHVAQKSITTGLPEAIISSTFASVNWNAMILFFC